jgi:Mn-containing catalase
LGSNIAADTVGFLMIREVVNQKQFEKALHSIAENVPAGKLRGKSGLAAVKLTVAETKAVAAMSARGTSDPAHQSDDRDNTFTSLVVGRDQRQLQ